MKYLQSNTLAKLARISTLRMVFLSQASHVASSLSLIDILSVIVANTKLSETKEFGSDLVVSKGHAAAGTYAVLAHAGYLPLNFLEEYSKDGAKLGGHVTSHPVPVIPLSTGSLGHGLSFGVGRSIAKKYFGKYEETFVVMSDGECNEGSVWEAAMFAGHHELSGMSVVIDRNGLQSLKGTEDTLRLEPLEDKWRSFGWDVSVCDGHDHIQLKRELFRISTKPRVIIANTIKGKGVSFMENSVMWHYKSPSESEFTRAIEELENS